MDYQLWFENSCFWETLLSFLPQHQCFSDLHKRNYRSSPPEVSLRKGVLKICSKFTGEHSCQLKPDFGMGVLQICCIFLEHLFLRTPLGGCFWNYLNHLIDSLIEISSKLPWPLLFPLTVRFFIRRLSLTFQLWPDESTLHFT